MRLMLALVFVVSVSACAKKQAPKSPAAIESQKTMEPAGGTGNSPGESAEDSKDQDTMKGDPCDGGESR
ncbi:MAG: hypothetical protein H0T89_03060 [Deltaproteobacteria bacterium]|nr:hypothetical protein [Deltaproteobacteria bacterium]MDQ3297263.1 hypothetical protein [Myxococcota bacterium]